MAVLNTICASLSPCLLQNNKLPSCNQASTNCQSTSRDLATEHLPAPSDRALPASRPSGNYLPSHHLTSFSCASSLSKLLCPNTISPNWAMSQQALTTSSSPQHNVKWRNIWAKSKTWTHQLPTQQIHCCPWSKTNCHQHKTYPTQA